MTDATPVSVANARALYARLAAASGETGGAGEIVPVGDPTEIRTGSLSNAGEGWQALSFGVPFEEAPVVALHAEGEHVAFVRNTTASGFEYKVAAVADGGLAETADAVEVRWIAVECGVGE